MLWLLGVNPMRAVVLLGSADTTTGGRRHAGTTCSATRSAVAASSAVEPQLQVLSITSSRTAVIVPCSGIRPTGSRSASPATTRRLRARMAGSGTRAAATDVPRREDGARPLPGWVGGLQSLAIPLAGPCVQPHANSREMKTGFWRRAAD